MPRVAGQTPSAPATDTTAADAYSKPLLSQVDEIESVLADISATLSPNVQYTPSVQAWIDAYNQQPLDWSALPPAADAGSTNMGLSTAKSDKKRAKKLQKLDVDKVNARILRKRQQVESFFAVLQPLLPSCSRLQCQQQSRKHQPCTATDAIQQQQQHEQPHQQQPESREQRQQQQHQHELPNQQQAESGTPLHVVDFGCGSGNLLLPLAALFPSCRFTGVDMKPAALQLLQQRAHAAGLRNVQVYEGMIEQYQQPFDVALALHACGNATDHVLQMAVEQHAAFIVSPCCVGKLKFSMTGGSSFHSSAITWTPKQPGDKPTSAASAAPAAAAAATVQAAAGNDHTPAEQPFMQQQQQQQQQNAAFGNAANAAVDSNIQQPEHQQSMQQQQQQSEAQATADDAAGCSNGCFVSKLQHPRSSWLRHKLPDPKRHFKIMARVADIAHAPADAATLGEVLKQRAAVADSCKRMVELDRCAAAAEAGYAVRLFQVLGAETMAKNDLLVGMPAAAGLGGCWGAVKSVSELVEQGLLLTAKDMGL